jgi:hypothetical protein
MLMKFRNVIVTVGLLALSVALTCCGDEEDDDNNEIFDPASQYYIQFKANGKLKTYEADDVGFNSGGEMTQCTVPPDQDEFAGIIMTNQSLAQITATQIESWANATFTLDSTESHPTFFFWGKDIYSSHVGENSSLTLTITAVELIGTQQVEGHAEQQLYKVTGTFSGKVTNPETGKTRTLTDGRFVAGFAEAYM